MNKTVIFMIHNLNFVNKLHNFLLFFVIIKMKNQMKTENWSISLIDSSILISFL